MLSFTDCILVTLNVNYDDFHVINKFHCHLFFNSMTEGHLLSGEKWMQWTNWGPCSMSCGTGTRVRTRQCINLAACSGIDKDVAPCHQPPCPQGMCSVYIVQFFFFFCSSYHSAVSCYHSKCLIILLFLIRTGEFLQFVSILFHVLSTLVF